MNVSELIEALEALPYQAEVIIEDQDYKGYEIVDLDSDGSVVIIEVERAD